MDAWQAAKWAEKRLKEEAGHITADVTQNLYWTALWVLYNKYDWKRFRLDRFRTEWLKLVDDVSRERLSIEDIVVTLQDEVYRGKMTSEDEIQQKAGVIIED